MTIDSPSDDDRTPPAGIEVPDAGAASAADADLDPAIGALLMQLFTAARESADKPWSLAKLSKRANLAMSTLRRNLADLADAGLVDVTLDEEGRGFATLTEDGLGVCEALFADDAHPLHGDGADEPGAGLIEDDDDEDDDEDDAAPGDSVSPPEPRRLH